MDQALALVDSEARFVSSNPVASPANPLHGTFTGVEGAKQFFGGFVELLERREIAPGWTFLPKQKQQTQAKYASDRCARDSQQYRIVWGVVEFSGQSLETNGTIQAPEKPTPGEMSPANNAAPPSN